MESDHLDLADEVMRKIGVNVLLFQQIEKSLKLLLPYILPHSNLAPKDIKDFQKYVKEFESKTLGGLVNKFIESVDYNTDYFAENLERIVTERNELVHNFGGLEGLNILSTEEGCRACIADLEVQRQAAQSFYDCLRLFMFGLLVAFREEYYKRSHGKSSPEIDQLYECLKTELKLQKSSVEYVNPANSSDTNWENTQIVKLLRLAEQNTEKIAGMTLLSKAGAFIKKQDPECTPKKYGIKTLKGVLKASGLFELAENQDGEQRGILYKSKAPH